MAIHVARRHTTHYRHDRRVHLGPRAVRLSPIPGPPAGGSAILRPVNAETVPHPSNRPLRAGAHGGARPSELAARLGAAFPAGHYDEWRGDALEPSGLAPAWAQFFDELGPGGLDELPAMAAALERQIRDNGITYNVYADADNPQRPWSLDLFPFIVSPEDWAHIETGVRQRVHLLDAILADLYGPRTLLREGLLPPALVQGHPGYLRAMHGVRPAGDTWLHIAAFDLAHGPDGRWWVVSQRTQAPSGLGYLLENRLAIGRLFPGAFEGLRVQRLAASYRALMCGLTALSPRGAESRIALLTPGPYNETYFEHAFLARYLGLPLVEGSDLTVRDRRLYLKTLQGLEPVDVLIKRLDDQWLDPLELRADSTLGVPGLLQAVRAGHLVLANAPGSAPLESPALLGFLPAIHARWFGEPLALPSLPTWWCGEAAALQDALPRLDRTVAKPTSPQPGLDTVLGPALSPAEREALAARIRSRPDDFALQAYLPLSQQPAWRQGTIVPRSAMVRVFALADGPRSWRVLPGGLVRLAPGGQQIATMQRGGSSADCWVRTHGDVDRTSLLRHAPSTLSLALHKRPVTSRAAENLFWLGRYTERTENTLRLARITLQCLRGEDADDPALLAWLTACARHDGLVLPEVPDAIHAPRVFGRALIAQLATDSGATSVGFNLRALRRAAGQVRERLSQEQRKLIDTLAADFDARCQAWARRADGGEAEVFAALEDASERLSAITGAQVDRMVRDDGWRLLSIGRLIERVAALAHALAAALQTDAVDSDAGYEALLDLFDSTITFHALYQQRRDLVALLDLLVTHRDNPRALAWVLSTLRTRVRKLPSRDPTPGEDLLAPLPDPDDWDLVTLSGSEGGHGPGAATTHLRLLELLQTCEASALRLAERLGHTYFSHADAAARTLLA